MMPGRWQVLATPGPARRGFTLVELLVAGTMLAILGTVIGSAIVLASKALPEADSPAVAAVDASAVAEELTDDVRYALDVLECTDRAITVTVPDRDGDGQVETIRYAWSGVAGDPLVREYNSTQATVLEDVHSLELSSRWTDTIEQKSVQTVSDEVVLASYDTSSDLDDFELGSDHRISQFFWPTLPEGTVRWEVTRVKLAMRSSEEQEDSNAELAVQLRPDDGTGVPSATVLDEVRVFSSDLWESYSWRDLAVAASDLSPDSGLCIVVKWVSGDNTGNVRYRKQGVKYSGLMTKSTDGVSWNHENDRALLFYVYGRTTVATTEQISHTHLAELRVDLQKGPDATGAITASCQPLNAPELLTGGS